MFSKSRRPLSSWERETRTHKRLWSAFMVVWCIMFVSVMSTIGVIVYHVVTKGPEYLQKSERLIDAVTRQLEKE